jgi:3-oxoacyl-[acyl-carrier protein] reductase
VADPTDDTSAGDFQDDTRLDGRVAVISGASSAMAGAIADGLARAGAKLVLGDIAAEPMELTSARLRSEGHDVLCEAVDVRRSAEVNALVATACTRFDRIDVMVNMAGVIHDAKGVDTTEADLDRVLSVNLKGVYFGCQAAARAMTERGWGSIVNMASSAGFTPIPMLASYSMSRAGVVALTGCSLPRSAAGD